MSSDGDVLNDRIRDRLRGMKRFLNEDYYDGGRRWWGKKDVSAVLNPLYQPPLPPDDPRIQAALQDWHHQGFIEFRGERDAFLRIIKPFNLALDLTDEEVECEIYGLKEYLNRCYRENKRDWLPLEAVRITIHPLERRPLSIENPLIRSVLDKWVDQGFVELSGDDALIRTLNPLDITSEFTSEIISQRLDRLERVMTISYAEGSGRWWTRANFLQVLSPPDQRYISPDDPRIQAALRDWEQTGHIAFPGNDHEFLKIIKPFGK